jgi:Ring finger domain
MKLRSGGSIAERMVAIFDDCAPMLSSNGAAQQSRVRIQGQRRLQTNGGVLMLESMTFFAIVMAFMLAVWVCCRIRQVPGQSQSWGAGTPSCSRYSHVNSSYFRCSIRATRRAFRRTEPSEAATTREMGAHMEQIDWYALQQEARARAGLPRGTGASSWFGAPTTTSREERREFLEQALLRQKYAVEAKPSTGTSPAEDDEERGDNSKACAICLDEYADGDDVCISYNRRCKHVFHRSCIINWLMNDETCPCCRQIFLAFEDVEAGRVGSTNSNHEGATRNSTEAATTTDEVSGANSESSRYPASLISSGWETVSLSSLFLGSSRHSSVGAIELCDPSSEPIRVASTVDR